MRVGRREEGRAGISWAFVYGGGAGGVCMWATPLHMSHAPLRLTPSHDVAARSPTPLYGSLACSLISALPTGCGATLFAPTPPLAITAFE